MTTDLEEQALRDDLPSPITEARLRRRLVAAGVAVGQGVATTAAAASGGTAAGGATVTGSAGSGLLFKLAGLSWGVKLGLAAAVAIPGVGLWLDSRHAPAAMSPLPSRARAPRGAAAPATPAAHAPAAARSPEPSEPQLAEPEPPAPDAKAPRSAAPKTSDVALAASPAPSRGSFSEPQSPSAAAQAATTLADETRLLDAAFAALAAGNRDRAAELIAEHAARYPHGLLEKERERAQTRLAEMSRGE